MVKELNTIIILAYLIFLSLELAVMSATRKIYVNCTHFISNYATEVEADKNDLYFALCH